MIILLQRSVLEEGADYLVSLQQFVVQSFQSVDGYVLGVEPHGQSVGLHTTQSCRLAEK